MRISALIFGAISLLAVWVSAVQAQDLRVSTVTRPPFSMVVDGVETGFSLDLLAAISENQGWTYSVTRHGGFSDMLGAVRNGQADMAVANISITADRELTMDFSQPIFESGLQILVRSDRERSASMIRKFFSLDFMGAVAIAFALLFLMGMVMWALERRRQPYFDRPAGEAMFPSFWWALNLLVNGGFEERVPQTFLGRILSVLMVLGSLFIVSLFVARITAIMTVSALQSDVNSLSDLAGQRVATIDGSTAASYLASRNLTFAGYGGLQEMTEAFEAGEVDALFFDAPILAWYALNSDGRAQLAGPVVQRENYGIALPSGSALAEPINQALLTLRETGVYDEIFAKWFGAQP